MLKKIYEWPHPVLKKTALPIGTYGDETIELAQNLIDTCNVMMGVGLAAPQIGSLKRMVVLDRNKLPLKQITDQNGIDENYWVLINPVLELSGERIKWVEGCLSIPRVEGPVERNTEVKLSYMTIDGEHKEIELPWPVSGAVQHECDHLDGIVYVLRQKKSQRHWTLKKYWKKKKKFERELKRNRANV